MKRLIPFILIGLLGTATASAQTKKTKAKTVTTKTTVKKTSKPKVNLTPATGELVSTNNYAAYSNRFSISDPTINAFNAAATGGNQRVSGSALMGIPRGTYGFANGRLFLRNTTATSSGAGYGSGSVGTGTTITSIGTSEATLGVNGKAPEAGRNLWGNGLGNPIKDSIRK